MKYLFTLLLFCLTLNGEQVLVIGSVADEPDKEFKEFTPFMEYLQKNTASVDKVKLKIYQSIPEISQAIINKEVDIYIDSPFSIKAVCLRTKATSLWRRWKKGAKEYTSVIFTTKAGSIKKLADLEGKVIAFEERFSSSSYLLPKYIMTKAKLQLVELKTPADQVPNGKVGYVFTQDDATTMFWVLRKKVVAGAMSSNSYVKKAKKRLAKLNILVESKAFPRHVICVRENYPAGIVDDIQQTLFNMHRTESGKKALITFAKTTKFDFLPEQSKQDMYKLESFIKAEFNIK